MKWNPPIFRNILELQTSSRILSVYLRFFFAAISIETFLLFRLFGNLDIMDWRNSTQEQAQEGTLLCHIRKVAGD